MNARTKQTIIARDGGRCALCGSPSNLTLHHVRPKVCGGPGYPYNVVTLCTCCHRGINKLTQTVAALVVWFYGFFMLRVVRNLKGKHAY